MKAILISLATIPLVGCSPQATTPAYFCGEASVIELHQGDVAATTSPVEDFLLHTINTADGTIVIYEGNVPDRSLKPAIERKTGMSWPQFVVVYDNRTEAGKAKSRLEGRLRFADERATLCPPRTHQ